MLWVLLPVLLAGLAAIGGLVLWVLSPTSEPGLDGVATTPNLTQRVEGGGSFAIWELREDGTPVRWNRCEPVRWVMNSDGAPPSAFEDLLEGFDRVSALTGIEFRFEGFTNEVPSRERPPYQPDVYDPDHWAPVLVAWVEADDTVVPLADDNRAVAVPVSVGRDGQRVFVTAQILFNRDTLLIAGYGERHGSIGATILHEVAHVVGLDHVEDPGELMYPYPGAGAVTFGPGDRAGLELLGLASPCVDTPEPAHVSVVYPDDAGDG